MKVIIIEDETSAAHHMVSVLKEINNIEVIAILDSISSTVEWFRSNNKPDLAFMDIHLADGSAFKIFDLVNISCPVIFTTAYDEYALKAFKVNSIDYLLKPITVEAVEKALEKLRNLSELPVLQTDIRRLISSLERPKVYRTHFLVPVKGSKLIPLQTKDIAYINIDCGAVKAKTFDGESYVIENTLDELASMLDPCQFFRANRQFIVSRASIKDVDFWFNSRLSLNLKIKVSDKILISKERVSKFKDWYSGVL